MESKASRKRVLVVDDAELNRAVLNDILQSDFDVVEADGGDKALEILQASDSEIAIVLLDLLMPGTDGFDVLAAMRKRGYLEYIPVIIISAETTTAAVDKAYEMGATDFISKPYNPNIVRHRVLNNIMLFNRQQTLMEIVTDQVYEQHRYGDMMINILSSVMEVKNGESGLHILHINTITRILAENLLRLTDKYSYTQSDIQLIAVASSLHDIGKMAIPDEIINKPGKLTPEEYEIMKTHSAEGAKLLDALTEYKDERLIQLAHDICLYHHERYDGRGYPCGLKGEEIPIWSQLVSVADVFDALISERVYKKAYTPEKAIQMITGGECGIFNPLIIDCLLMSTDRILAALTRMTAAEKWEEKVKSVADEVVKYHVDGFSNKTFKKIAEDSVKQRFYASLSDGILFEYSIADNEIVVRANPSLGVESEYVFDPTDRETASKIFNLSALDKAIGYLRTVTPDKPNVSFDFEKEEDGKLKICTVNMLFIYDESNNSVVNIVGKITKRLK